MEVDYKNYSLDELYDIEENIDREKYPERYNLIISLIGKKENCSEALNSTKSVKDEAEMELHQQILEKNNGAWLLIRFSILAIFCSYLMFQEFANYQIIIIVVAYLAFIALLKQMFLQYHLSKASKLESDIKKTGIHKK